MDFNRETDGKSTIFSAAHIWKTNLLVFAVLVIVVQLLFYLQIRQTRNFFSAQVDAHANMVAGVIRTTTDHAVQTRTVVEEIISNFLAGHARFLDLLDQLQPFTAAELANYVEESELAGVRLLSASAPAVGVPENWLLAGMDACAPGQGFARYFPDQALYILNWPREKSGGCVQLAFDMTAVDQMQEAIALPHLLQTLSHLDGMTAVSLQPYASDLPSPSMGTSNSRLNEMQLPLDYGLLTVTVNADRFLAGSRQLWQNFVGFSFFLVVLGLLFSAVLYRYQRASMERTRGLEERLHRQREEADLGRATASISHEIRNPLNALSIGLQRLQLDADHFSLKQQRLLASMQQAVERTDNIVRGLHRYAKPLRPEKIEFDFMSVCRSVRELFNQQAVEQNVEFSCEGPDQLTLYADQELIIQVIENLIKNALEAQSHGGVIRLKVEFLSVDSMLLKVINGTVSIAPDHLAHCLDPYFTTGTHGTGLGLPLAKRIVEAHGGRLTVDLLADELFQVLIILPLKSVDSPMTVDFSFLENS